jgi:hypothetical protein
MGLDTGALGPRICDRSSRGHPGMGTRVSIHKSACLSDLVRQRPLSASRGETRCDTYRNRHPCRFGAEDSRLETSARRLTRKRTPPARPRRPSASRQPRLHPGPPGGHSRILAQRGVLGSGALSLYRFCSSDRRVPITTKRPSLREVASISTSASVPSLKRMRARPLSTGPSPLWYDPHHRQARPWESFAKNRSDFGLCAAGHDRRGPTESEFAVHHRKESTHGVWSSGGNVARGTFTDSRACNVTRASRLFAASSSPPAGASH